MLKYILKRLLISLIILLGVSIIIYTLVRLMPSDYVDVKFSSQLQSGAITRDDIDRFKELYGINMPDAYLTVDIKEGEYAGKYVRNVHANDHDFAEQSETEMAKWILGSYAKGEVAVQLAEDGLLTVSRVYYEERTTTYIDDDGKEATRTNEVKVSTPLADGRYTATIAGDEVTLSVTLGGQTADSEMSYRVANFFDKLGSVFQGYFTWIGKLLQGDLGISFKYEKPVAQVISENMWISFTIAVIATVLQFLIAIPLGITSATHQYSKRDYIVTVLTMIGISFPTYFFAAIMIKFFSVDLRLLPSTGLISASASYPATFAGFWQKFGDMAQHLILPIFVSVVLSIGGLMRYTRTNTLEVLNADYIRTARAKGLSESKVIYRHAFRNTLIPLATLLAGILPSLFGGMMITEQVFAIDGIGRLAYQALKDGDIPFIMGYNMFLAVLTVIGTLLSDIMYSVVDPRVKLAK